MRKVGMITIGQAPRQDIAPIVEKHLAGRAELVQAGVLDQMTKAEIASKLAPTAGDYVLTSRLTSGESVVLSRERIQPILQQKIADMERSGIRNILLLCTGVFPGLRAEQAFLLEPDRIIPPMAAIMAKGRRLGVLVPLAEQVEALREKYAPHGLEPIFAVVSPFALDRAAYQAAIEPLKDKVDVLLMDCMGYTEEARELVSELTGLPVVLSSAFMAKLIAEWCS
ncbi:MULTISPECIES: AroM family protein [Brevibacillus]|jgi:AroM protein.|uniref:AroM family protein n=1 Tax=Brevibacillus TaxID=55080 RepID=UPI000EBC6BBD|nr:MULTISPECIES: AroM family protein [Brevibacillus]MBU8712613.1 AroM family protein [Brevibacillus parabrevis]MDH6348112.1 protein AroM [Brevibacillus sp. 1238]MDR5000237.1 AroM family protein [Brevibacillus parabrevis]HBZ79756.1 AroM protein [Brevibacillus sp.]